MSAGCCFGRGGKQGECSGQVRVLTRDRVGDAVSEQKNKQTGPGIADMRAGGRRCGSCI